MANLSAVDLRNQIQSDRKAAHEELDRKFDTLLELVAETYGIGNLVPAAPKRTRQRKAANENAATTEATTETANNAVETDPYYLTEQFRDVNTSINEHLLEAGAAGLSMKELTEKTGHQESVVRDSVKYLLDQGTITKTGVKRGTRYLAATQNNTGAGNGNA